MLTRTTHTKITPPDTVSSSTWFRDHDTSLSRDLGTSHNGSLINRQFVSGIASIDHGDAKLVNSRNNPNCDGGSDGTITARDNFAGMSCCTGCSGRLPSINWVGLAALARGTSEDRVGLRERCTSSVGAGSVALTAPDPHAEGRRARAAGLSADENPYLWPPGARELWAAGFSGEPK